MLEMAWIREKLSTGRYQISEHVIRFLMAGFLTMPEIEAAIQSGTIAEMTPPSRRAASLLIKGQVGDKTILVRVSRGAQEWLILSLAYLARLPQWAAMPCETPNKAHSMQTVFHRCFFCGGEIKAITVGNFDYRLEGRLYVIKDTPAGLCLQCGEKYVTAETAKEINALIAAGQFSQTEEVRVLAFPHAT